MPSAEEVGAILRAAGELDPRYRAGILVVAATGMRRGEVCRLRWGDVDFADATLAVDEAVIAAEGGATAKSPKTRASVRRLAVDDATLGVLEDLRAIQADLAGLTNRGFGDEAFVLSTEPGGTVPLHPDTMSKAFAKARKVAGVAADVHLHSLRHFQATTLDSVISERQKQSRLGWSTVHMARHYTDRLRLRRRRQPLLRRHRDRHLPLAAGGLVDLPLERVQRDVLVGDGRPLELGCAPARRRAQPPMPTTATASSPPPRRRAARRRTSPGTRSATTPPRTWCSTAPTPTSTGGT